MHVARTRGERMRGLRGRGSLQPGETLLIPDCHSIHTFGMRFPIAVAFLDGDMRVIEVVRMRPNRLVRPRFSARHVLECEVGTEVRPGDFIKG